MLAQSVQIAMPRAGTHPRWQHSGLVLRRMVLATSALRRHFPKRWRGTIRSSPAAVGRASANLRPPQVEPSTRPGVEQVRCTFLQHSLGPAITRLEIPTGLASAGALARVAAALACEGTLAGRRCASAQTDLRKVPYYIRPPIQPSIQNPHIIREY